MGIETQILYLLDQGAIEFVWDKDPAEAVCPECGAGLEVLYIYGKEKTSGDWNDCDVQVIADRCPKCKETNSYAELNEWIDHVLNEWDDGWKFFGRMKIKFAEGWRNKYPDIPIIHDLTN